MSESSPFWKFSLALYAGAGAPEACLELQEGAGADVNVVLFLLWLATRRRRLGIDEQAEIIRLVDPWRREVVAGLRQARRASKEPLEGFDRGAVASLRLAVKRAELEAERIQQDALYAWRAIDKIGVDDEAAAAAASNLHLYEAALGRSFSPASRDRLIAAALALSTQGDAR